MQRELEQSMVLSCSELYRSADNYVIKVIWYKQSQKVRCEQSTVIISQLNLTVFNFNCCLAPHSRRRKTSCTAPCVTSLP
jgi:hypothetical protein